MIEAIPADREILFLPDLYLGLWLERVTGRKLRIWLGECHVHAGIRPADIERWHGRGAGRRAARPPGVRLREPGDGVRERPHADPLDRGDGQLRAASRRSERFLVATETGILHRLRREAPGKRFEPVREDAVCRFMKMITLEKVRDSLRDGTHEVTVEPEIAERARGAIDRMLAIG